MNQQIEKLAKEAGAREWGDSVIPAMMDIEKFAQSIVYDFLSELTNDDSLGEARIATIRRLAEKWGVKR